MNKAYAIAILVILFITHLVAVSFYPPVYPHRRTSSVTTNTVSATPVLYKRYPHITLAQCPLLPVEMMRGLARHHPGAHAIIGGHEKDLQQKERLGTLPALPEPTAVLPLVPELILRAASGEILVDPLVRRNVTEKLLCDYNKWSANNDYYHRTSTLSAPAPIAHSPYIHAVRKSILPHFTVVIGIPSIDNVVHANVDVDIENDGPTGAVRRAKQRATWLKYSAVWSSEELERYMINRIQKQQHYNDTHSDKRVLVRFLLSRHHHINFVRQHATALRMYDYSPQVTAEAAQHRDVLFLELEEGVSEKRLHSGDSTASWGKDAEFGMSRKSLWLYAILFRMYSYDYIMKADDDVYLNVPQYLTTLDLIVSPRMESYDTNSSSRDHSTIAVEHPGNSPHASAVYRGAYYGGLFLSGPAFHVAGWGITLSRNTGALLLSDVELYTIAGTALEYDYARYHFFNKSEELTSEEKERWQRHQEFVEQPLVQRHIYQEDLMVGAALRSMCIRRSAPRWWWQGTPPDTEPPLSSELVNDTITSAQKSYDGKTADYFGAMGILAVRDCRYVELHNRKRAVKNPILVHHVSVPLYAKLFKKQNHNQSWHTSPHWRMVYEQQLGHYLLGCVPVRKKEDFLWGNNNA